MTARSAAQEYRRWQINPDGSITWHIKNDIPHNDHIEMSGKRISCVLRYSVEEDGSFEATRSLVWPTIRTIPNNTHASLTRRYAIDAFDFVTVNQKPMPQEVVQSITLDGTLLVRSQAGNDLALTRRFFPSMDETTYCEYYVIHNLSSRAYRIEIPEYNTIFITDSIHGVDGCYTIYTQITGDGFYTLGERDSVVFSMAYMGWSRGRSHISNEIEYDFENRITFISQTGDHLILETPDTVLNTAFAFAKVRASESIFETKGGLMHGPGGEAYYAAIWANDQGEYVGPFFPFLGNDNGNKASFNAYQHFARFMNPEFKPIPSSIIAEGTDIWNGAGDRGDAAMIAYGASRYALARGDEEEAEKLWPLIEWCLEYCHRKLNKEGVVLSDTDELEGRFPAGKANLCTSSLYYDALISAVYLGVDLEIDKRQVNKYLKQASALKISIEKYFGASIGGFETYKYYKENDTLRSWICIPLTMGIFDRKAGTIDALFSPQLWTQDGLATISGGTTFWDRSTLYALRGVFAAGETAKALDFLHYYSNRRLLGDHVPYPVEAYPEGNQRHLSAESGLYCRVLTEGLFGIRPTGFKSFDLTPQLPAVWPSMSLRHIHAFSQEFDIVVSRSGDKLNVVVSQWGEDILNKLIEAGETVQVSFPE
ncbi:MAG TPA: hypothetical protein VGK46_02205 [Saprospiraceae bacterium]